MTVNTGHKSFCTVPDSASCDLKLGPNPSRLFPPPSDNAGHDCGASRRLDSGLAAGALLLSLHPAQGDVIHSMTFTPSATSARFCITLGKYQDDLKDMKNKVTELEEMESLPSDVRKCVGDVKVGCSRLQEELHACEEAVRRDNARIACRRLQTLHQRRVKP
eukprot:s548_g22.t1